MKRAGVVFALVLAGCTDPATQVIVGVANQGVVIPDQVRSVQFTIIDATVGEPVASFPVQLCNGSLQTQCQKFPFTVGIVPGPSGAEHSMRLEVDGLDAGGTAVLKNAALLKFTSKSTVHVDFALWPNCFLPIDCSQKNQACDNGTCKNVGNLPPAGDMAITLPPPDIATAPIDMAGCPQCAPGTACFDGKTCARCGAVGEPCCPGASACTNPTTSVCDGTNCVDCATVGHPCCGNNCNATLVCMTGRCELPPPPDLAHSPMDMCTPNPTCGLNAYCGAGSDGCGGVCTCQQTQVCNNATTYCGCNPVACTTCGGVDNCGNPCPACPDMATGATDLGCSTIPSCMITAGAPSPFPSATPEMGTTLMQCVQANGCGTSTNYPNARCDGGKRCCGQSGLPCCNITSPPCDGALVCTGNVCG